MMISDFEIMAQVLAAFREEQVEHRQAIGELLLELEREPQHAQRRPMVDQLFREAHSLKGSARAAGQAEIEQLAHRLEDVLSAVRQDALELTPDVCDPIYAALDVIGALADDVVAGVPTSLTPHATLVGMLDAVLGAVEVRPTARDAAPGHTLRRPLPPTAEPGAPPDALTPPADEPSLAESQRDHAHAKGETTTVRLPTETLDRLLGEASDLITCTVRAEQRARAAQALSDPLLHWRRLWRQTRPALSRLQKRADTVQPIIHFLDRPAPALSSAAGDALDHDTVTLVEALVEAQRVITDLERRLQTHARDLGEDHDRLAAVSERLHDQLRRTRMLPLTTVLAPLRLQLRDMARVAGKQIQLDVDDGGAEADRQVLDRLRDVLLHLLRNAVDHGVEAPETRTAAGKPAVGRLTLCTAVVGDRLTITLADDGAGLDLEGIRRRALSAGLATEADARQMSAAELGELIFTPGFSTRQTVGMLSGRGVGLDVVRSQVERMYGRVMVDSTPGQGTTFRISVPLSLTSTQSLLVRAAGSLYALPLERIERIVPVQRADTVTVEGRTALLLGSRPAPLVRLAAVLGMAGPPAGDAGSTVGLALILSSGDRPLALLVDGIEGEQELVVQRLPAPLHHVPFLDGATILADGAVVPILDVVDVLRASLGAPTAMIAPPPTAASAARKPIVVVVDDSITTRTLERNILESAGFRVRLATNGAEALELLEALHRDGGCDLLLSDVDMPRLSGFELTARVRADSRFAHLPVVLVTSLEAPNDREQGIAAGADAYIVKRAFDQQILLETINQLI